jgi:HSP20 family protein
VSAAALEKGRIVLRDERKHEAEVKEERYQRRERAYGSFQRAFWLPTTVDAEKIQASFKDGLLELRLPTRARRPSLSTSPSRADSKANA